MTRHASTPSFRRRAPFALGALAAAALATLTLGAGCARDPSTTGIVLDVHSDLEVPREMSRLTIRVTSAGKRVFERSQDLGLGSGRVALPTRLGLVPAGDGTGSFTVEVVGQLGSTDVISRKAILPFVRGSILVLRIDLLKECVGLVCDEALTCVQGRRCADPTVDPATLPKLDGGTTDGGAGDGGDRQDGPPGVESGVESGVDSGVETGAEVRDGPVEPPPDAGPDGPVLTCNPGTTPIDFPDVDNIVSAAAFSPTGDRLATGGLEMDLRIWDVGTVSVIRPIMPSPYTLLGVAFSPDGLTLAAASARGKASLWNVNDGSLKFDLVGHTDNVTAAAFSPDGLTVATGSWDGNVILWNATSGSQVRKLPFDKAAVRALVFLGNDKLVTADDAAGFGGEGVKLWDANAGTIIRSFTGPLQFHGSNAVAVNADATLIADGQQNGITFLWNPGDNSAPVKTLRDANTLSDVNSVGFSPDGKRLVAGIAGGTASVWEVASGQLIRTLMPMGIPHVVAFSPTGKTVLTAGGDYVKLWGCE